MKKKIAITKEKVLIALFVMIYAAVVLSWVSKVGTEHIAQAKLRKELSNMQAYEVYSTYVMMRESFYVYMMCNPNYALEDVIDGVLDEQYFDSLKSRVDEKIDKLNQNADKNISSLPTRIFMMLPSKEEGILYGWKKDELNISLNFDTSAFHRMTQCIITVPYGAMSLEDCTIEYQNAD